MADYRSLTHALPEFVDLHELAALVRFYEGTQDDEGFEELWGDEWASLKPLIAAIDGHCGVGNASRNGAVLIAEGHWVDYCQDYASDVEGISTDSHLYQYIDWEQYADDMKENYSEIQIDEGEFAGTWYIRNY